MVLRDLLDVGLLLRATSDYETGHLLLLGFKGDEAAALGARGPEQHLEPPGADAWLQILQAQAPARQDLRPQI